MTLNRTIFSGVSESQQISRKTGREIFWGTMVEENGKYHEIMSMKNIKTKRVQKQKCTKEYKNKSVQLT